MNRGMILSFFKRPTVDVEDIWRTQWRGKLLILLTALIIVVGWNCAGKYYDELPDNLQRFVCNILYVSIGWVNRFSALIVFQLIKFYRYSPVSLEKLSKASHSKLLPLWKFLNFLGLQMISCTLSRMQNQLESNFLYRQNPNRDGKLLAVITPTQVACHWCTLSHVNVMIVCWTELHFF